MHMLHVIHSSMFFHISSLVILPLNFLFQKIIIAKTNMSRCGSDGGTGNAYRMSDNLFKSWHLGLKKHTRR
jgi:hypothetical protein